MIEHLTAALDFPLTEVQRAAFERYAADLLTWNERINLTAITEPEEVAVRHFADSLSLLRVLGEPPPGTALIDVGTGAGFPGLPLKIVRPALSLTLADSVGKKTGFLEHMVAALDLEDVTVLHARAEDLGQQATHRERYQWAVARAVAHLPVLAEYLLPLCAVGGYAIAMKGDTAHREAQEAAHALEVLGGRVQAIERVGLPGVPDPHHLIVIEKTAPTPAKYPRRAGMPSKRPL